MSNPYLDMLGQGAGQAIPQLVPLVVFAVVALGTLALFKQLVGPERRRSNGNWRRKGQRQWRNDNVARFPPARNDPPGSRVPDAAEQLRIVMASEFKPKRLLNKGEQKVLAALEPIVAELQPGWRVWTQVSLGEVLDGSTVEAFNTINAKRVDFLLVDADQRPRLAIEYQGQGHHQGAAAARDAVKREALRRAGVGYGEVFAGDGPAELAQVVARVMAGAGVERTFGVQRERSGGAAKRG
jgi:hypothetical protein